MFHLEASFLCCSHMASLRDGKGREMFWKHLTSDISWCKGEEDICLHDIALQPELSSRLATSIHIPHKEIKGIDDDARNVFSLLTWVDFPRF